MAQKLKCSIQQYHWGKVGSSSHVARLSTVACGNIIDEEQNYAELWMGTHPRGPSYVITENNEEVLLAKWLADNPTARGRGATIASADGYQLLYLFKVLSVAKSLSIQAHPNKSFAKVLHERDPKIYPDDNHKPEMAIALTDFEMLCAFRPLVEIAAFITKVPELAAVVGQSPCAHLLETVSKHAPASGSDGKSKALKGVFESLINADKQLIKAQLELLIERLSSMKDGKDKDSQLGELILRLNSHYPGDIGCFVAYLLNHLTLKPGEAVFLAANVPHAYLSGDCVECMACSDNVVRAGLTPKMIDVRTLCTILEYTPTPVEDVRHAPKFVASAGDVRVYAPGHGVRDFGVERYELLKQASTIDVSVRDSPSIFLVIKGEGSITTEGCDTVVDLVPGTPILLPAHTKAKLYCSSKKELQVFRAFSSL